MWQRFVFYIVGFAIGVAMTVSLNAPDPLLKWLVAIICTAVNIGLVLVSIR